MQEIREPLYLRLCRLLYRPRLLRHLVRAYAALAAGGSCPAWMAAGGKAGVPANIALHEKSPTNTRSRRRLWIRLRDDRAATILPTLTLMNLQTGVRPSSTMRTVILGTVTHRTR
jgi:hypothetical protein